MKRFMYSSIVLLLTCASLHFPTAPAKAVTVDVYLRYAVFKEIEIADNWSSPDLSYVNVVDPGDSDDQPVPEKIDKRDIVQLVFDTYRVRFMDGTPQPPEAIIIIKEYPNAFVGAAISLAALGLGIWQLGEWEDDRDAATEAAQMGLSLLKDEFERKASNHLAAAGGCAVLSLMGVAIATQSKTVKITPEGYRLANVVIDPIQRRVCIVKSF